MSGVKNSVLHLTFYVWCEQWSTFLLLVLGRREHTKSLSPFDDVVDKTPVIRSVVLKLLLKYRWAPRTWSCLRNTLTSLFFFSSWLFLCHKAFFAELVASSLSGKASLARDALVPLSVWTVSLAYSHAGHEFIMATSTWWGRRRQIWGKGTEHCEMCGYRKWGVRNLQFSSQFHSYKVLWVFLDGDLESPFTCLALDVVLSFASILKFLWFYECKEKPMCYFRKFLESWSVFRRHLLEDTWYLILCPDLWGYTLRWWQNQDAIKKLQQRQLFLFFLNFILFLNFTIFY